MPIEVEIGPLKVFRQDDYQEVSYAVMGHIFDHLERFLAHTPLVRLQWVNLNHHRFDGSFFT